MKNVFRSESDVDSDFKNATACSLFKYWQIHISRYTWIINMLYLTLIYFYYNNTLLHLIMS